MARKKKPETKRPIESYEHRDKQRVNNPPVGLVTPDTDPDAGAKKTYAYDPQLVWAGKAERISFELPTVSLHVHERIDPCTIIEALKRRNGAGQQQMTLFEVEREEPLRQAVEFYQHAHGWSNRMVAGDSLLVMNSLLEKEGMAGKVQMVYIDPPYGIRYGSNFQPFVNKRDVKDGKDEDMTAEPEQIRAFRESGGEDRIAVWLLDTDYDGRSLYPRQVFFPMAGAKEGWARLARNLKAEIDEELIEAYRGTVSLPFEPGEHWRIAVKIVDGRGIESLKILELPE